MCKREGGRGGGYRSRRTTASVTVSPSSSSDLDVSSTEAPDVTTSSTIMHSAPYRGGGRGINGEGKRVSAQGQGDAALLLPMGKVDVSGRISRGIPRDSSPRPAVVVVPNTASGHALKWQCPMRKSVVSGMQAADSPVSVPP